MLERELKKTFTGSCSKSAQLDLWRRDKDLVVENGACSAWYSSFFCCFSHSSQALVLLTLGLNIGLKMVNFSSIEIL